MAVTELNKVQYVDQDWATAIQGIKNFLQTNYPEDFTDYEAGNLGQALIDILGYAVQNLNWLLNRKVTDLYFPTAISPNAITKIARMLGYKPKGATGSIVELTVTLAQGPYTFPVTINKGFQFKGPSGLIFEYRGNVPIVYAPGETVKTFEVREGETRVSNFISDGTNNQIFRLLNVPSGKYVEQGTIEVRVNGELWSEYDIIPFQTINAYETNILTSPPFIKFGDSVQGNVPPAGANIEIRYITVSGFLGRIVSNVIENPVRPLISNFTTIPFLISQPNASIGGDNPEDLRSIVVNAPKFQRTQDRAITKGDYDYLTNLFPNVAKGDAQILRSVTGDIFINGQYSAIYDTLKSIDSEIESISGYGLIPPEAEHVSGYAQSISGLIPQIQSTSGAIASVITEQTTNIFSKTSDSISELLTIAGDPACSAVVQSVTGYLNEINSYASYLQEINTSTSGLSKFDSYISSISGNILSIDNKINTIIDYANDTTQAYVVTGYTQSISGYLQGIYDYLDYHYSDGCRGNLVQVSILSKDANRRYVAPAISTINDLSAYLNARKDAVHTIKVVSGDVRVINADVLIELKMTDAANPEDVIKRVKNKMIKSDVEPLGILVERDFNKSLYLSEIYDAIDEVTESFELKNANVIIQGPSGFLDNRGNLIAPDGFVIQAGNVQVVSI